MAELSRSYRVGAYPMRDGTPLGWRNEINEWLHQIGENIFRADPFRVGLIGWEPTDSLAAEHRTIEEMPAQRSEGYLWPQGAEVVWYPPTLGAPMEIG
ncbi:MAG: hypothetical protein HY611_01035 [Elusimicrobia bacterium]|nr:hypothetical protein [Elusimicrobiota bacterium]